MYEKRPKARRHKATRFCKNLETDVVVGTEARLRPKGREEKEEVQQANVYWHRTQRGKGTGMLALSTGQAETRLDTTT